MIQRIVERLIHSKKADMVIIATSDSDADNKLVVFGESLGIPVFRGSEQDVLERLYQCAIQFGLDDIIRATGDNPFVDIEACDKLVDLHRLKDLDYTSAKSELNSGYPTGIGLEIMRFSALEHSWREGTAPHHREHVDEYILENPALFRQAALVPPPTKHAPHRNFTVDTPEQFARAELLIHTFETEYPGQEITTEWLLEQPDDCG